MESPLISRVFRQLFSHETCSRVRYSWPTLPRILRTSAGQIRKLSSQNRTDDDSARGSNWQQRTDLFPEDKRRDFERYPMVTANATKGRKERPKRVKMLTRDFIEGGEAKVLGVAIANTMLYRQPIQSKLWLLLQASCHLQSWRAIRLP